MIMPHVALRVLAVTFAALVTLPATAFEGENLLVTAPAGYKAGFSDRNAKMVMTEFVPAGQSVQNWTEMVTVQVFLGMKRASPAAFRDRMEKLWAGSCAKAAMVPISAATENGYEVVLWRLTCPLNKTTGKPEMTWFKAIAGNDSFYVVQKAFKFEPPSEKVAEWIAYLNKVSVCDTRLPERACPSGMR
jgi:hypothetical protein